ncbi:hypothetical protein Tco_1488988 [Tanacetum coccineum]
MDNSRQCQNMMLNLFTPANLEFFNEVVRNESAVKRSWKMLCQSAQQQANTLLRFEALMEEHADLVYAHESCKDDRVEELEEEKKESEHLNSKQADRIKQLKEALTQSEADAHQFYIRLPNIRDRWERFLALPLERALLTRYLLVELFDRRYLYIDKVARMYLLDPSGLKNIMPDETRPTRGGGPRDTPTASYA